MKEASTDFPFPLTAENIIHQQVPTPELLKTFFQTLITGSSEKPSSRVDRYINSLCDDCLFTSTKGAIKPVKHTCLGLGLKSITGSRKVIEILNHFGHCLHYNTIEELETDLAISIEEQSSTTPSELQCTDGLSTSLAWDNFDHNNETLSGKDTLHDTVGICYQNIMQVDETCSNDKENQPNLPTNKKRLRKRTLDSGSHNIIEPYRKKPRIDKFVYHEKISAAPSHLKQMTQRDFLWTMACYLSAKTPMWIGWNSRYTEDTLPLQRIGYMDNIKLPPTRLDVVAETLKKSQKVAEECKQKYIVVHYDLAIAKPAKQIQSTESPVYDNVFICFGPFHIQLAYFASLGYIIEDSGITDILIDCEALGSGSLKVLLHGKHYNRCKRLHPIIFLALRHLHLKEFLAKYPLPQAVCKAIEQLSKNQRHDVVEEIEQSQEMQQLMCTYESFLQDTRCVLHGKTAQFWIHYTDLVHLQVDFAMDGNF